VLAELNELVCFSMRHGLVGYALKRLRTMPYLIEEVVRSAVAEFLLDISHEEIETIQVFPHFAADLLANAARVFSSKSYACSNRIRIGRMPKQKTTHVLRIEFPQVFGKERSIAGYIYDPAPRIL
jgi:hypothetical protein